MLAVVTPRLPRRATANVVTDVLTHKCYRCPDCAGERRTPNGERRTLTDPAGSKIPPGPRARRQTALELHQQVCLKHHVAAITCDWPLLRRADTRNIAGRKTTIEILGQRLGVIERQDPGQKVGEIVSRVK